MKFNEDSRVKIPTILHLIRLGYEYLSLKDVTWDIETNIFPELFIEAISRLNPDIEKDDITVPLHWLLPMLMNGQVRVK